MSCRWWYWTGPIQSPVTICYWIGRSNFIWTVRSLVTLMHCVVMAEQFGMALEWRLQVGSCTLFQTQGLTPQLLLMMYDCRKLMTLSANFICGTWLSVSLIGLCIWQFHRLLLSVMHTDRLVSALTWTYVGHLTAYLEGKVVWNLVWMDTLPDTNQWKNSLDFICFFFHRQLLMEVSLMPLHQ